MDFLTFYREFGYTFSHRLARKVRRITGLINKETCLELLFDAKIISLLQGTKTGAIKIR